MNDKFFMDSNILIYTFDSHAPRKQEKARELVATAPQNSKRHYQL